MKSNSCLFSPASTFWRVNREWLINLAGGRALLLELAHPLVAAGVAQHSRFQQHPLRRLWRTFAVMNRIVFGNEAARRLALRAFAECHRNVQGRVPAAEGNFSAGVYYHAHDPELKLWVLATLIDSALLGYETFVAPLNARDKQAYYQDGKRVAPLLGIPERLLPATHLEFESYMSSMLASEVLRVGEPARQIVAAMLQVRALGPMLKAFRFFGVGLLPVRLREEYRFAWSRQEEERLQHIAASIRRSRQYLPDGIAIHPKAWWGEVQTRFAPT